MQAIGRQPQRAPDGVPVHYERHRPEQTSLFWLVQQQHVATFFAQAEAASGADLPQFVKDEFDAFLECGILAHGLVPDNDHYRGSFAGRVLPLWADAEASKPNLRGPLLTHLSDACKQPVGPEDLFAYIAAVAAHPGYIERFRSDLATPGLRIPLTAQAATFFAATELGRRIVWLHTFGERYADPQAGRDPGAPRLPVGRRPQVPKGGAIPTTPEGMPDTLTYNVEQQRLNVGSGYIEPVPPAVWHYQVSGKQVLVQWFSYRKKTRERPLIRDRRKPSPLGDIQPDHWLAEYTTELLNVLNVLGLLVELEPQAAELLESICSGPLISEANLRGEGVFFPEGHTPASSPAQQSFDL